LIDDESDKPIDTVAASAFLKDLGFPYAIASLDRMRSAGGGPRFLKHGARVFYRPSALRAWIDSKTREVSCNSELRENPKVAPRVQPQA
jgi:hypothetical protein